MTDENIEIYKLWRIRHTIFQLCHDRGYLVTQEELNETYELFKSKYHEDDFYRTIQVAHSENNEQMYVFFPDEPKIGIKTIQDYVSQMEKNNVRRAIVVVRLGLTPSAKQAMKDVAPEYILEDFMESEMLINITEHELVPQHILLTEDEKQDLFSRYKLQESQLMKMLITDPIARYYGFKRGQVIKIIRKSDTAGRYVTHRLVV